MQLRASQPTLYEVSKSYAPSKKHAHLRAVQAKAASEGDVAALVKSVEGTIRSVVGHFGRGLAEEDREDLIAAGRVGAVVATKGYDASRGSFNNWAKIWIWKHVAREAIVFWSRGRCSTETEASKVFFRYGQVQRRLERDGVASTPEAVAKELGVSSSLFAKVMAAVSPVPYEEGAEEPVHESEEMFASIDAQRAIAQLPPRQRIVIRKRFFDGLTLAKIGGDLDLTEERVRQIQAQALKNLREILSKE